ncbi:hypothetical protein MKZ38_004373 [Zalerion maritima]|uniref:60S ribosomal protein L27 n=1 Tax=Zalerion maritima TaxID=339359 RepID=A0AAD5RLK6_9PEZI|nr:hypothetical protein MKZ38_004373 [Zalerion maritima]
MWVQEEEKQQVLPVEELLELDFLGHYDSFQPRRLGLENPGGGLVVIIQPVDTGNKAHPYGHALVVGIDRYPSKITRRMGKARQERRSKIKPFIKAINYNHLMPTRYTLELEGLKGSLSNDTFKEPSQREDAKKAVKKVLEDRYTSGKNRWFFTPLTFATGINKRLLTSTNDTEEAGHWCHVLCICEERRSSGVSATSPDKC